MSPAHRTLYRTALFAVTAILILPLWTVALLPWLDFPGHLARVFVEYHYSEVPIFQRYFEIQPILLANLAIDILGPPLLRWFDPYTAAQVFVSLIIVLFVTGCHLLGRELHDGNPTWLAVPSAFFFYNTLLLWGYVNYMASVAMFLLAAAWWVRCRRTAAVLPYLLAAALGFATFVAHLAGFVFLCVFAGVWTAVEILQARRVTARNVLGFVPLLPGLLAYGFLDKGADAPAMWVTPVEKVRHGWALFSGYSTWMDAGMFAGLAIVAVMVWRFGRLTWPRPALAVAAALLLAFLVFPTIRVRLRSEARRATDSDSMSWSGAAGKTISLAE